MKILQIRLQNINSIKGEHTIDFREDPLSSAGLFAITGPTGSGKTTILDVITLALFSRIPRVGDHITKSYIEKTGMILTRNMDEAVAEITYACNEGEFTSRWSISKNSKGNLNDYTMQISDAAGNLLDLKKSEVPGKNEALIGLNFDQFSKAIILAQGDFAAFLKAKKDDRGKLLEKITGTWIYRELGKLAFEKNRDLGQQLEMLERQAGIKKEQLISAEEYNALISGIEQADTQIAECKKQLEQLTNQENLKTDISALSQSINNAEEELTLAREKQATFREQNGQRMEKHAHLLPYRTRLWDWKGLQQRLEEQQESLEKIKNNLLACDERESRLKEEVKTLTGSDAPPTEALELFRNKVLNLQTQLGNAKTLLQNTTKSAEKDAEQIPLTLNLSEPSKAMAVVDQESIKNTAELKRLTDKLPEAYLEQPTSKLEELRKISEVLQSILSETALLKEKQIQRTQLENNINNLQNEVTEIPTRLTEAIKAQKEAEQKLEGLQKDKTIRDLTAILEEHRKKLKDGEPCPLCGATEHPYSEAIPPAEDDLDKEIKNVNSLNEEWKRTISTLNSTLALKQESLQKSGMDLKKSTSEVNIAEEKVRLLKAGVPANYQAVEPDEALKRVKEEINGLEKYRELDEKGRRLSTLTDKLQECKEHYQTVSTLSQQLNVLFPTGDILAVTQNLAAQFTSNNTSRQSLSENQENMQKSHSETKQRSQVLTEQLMTEIPEYDSPATALPHLMDDAEYTSLQTQGQQLAQDISNMEAGLNVHRQNLENLKAKDTDTSIDEIRTLKQARETESTALTTKRDELKGKQVVQKRIQEELVSLNEQIAGQKKQNEKWVLLNKYIGDAQGKRFSTFAQELTLLQLIQKANNRMKHLNDRYLLGVPDEEEDDSLAVVDTHMGDTRRSVKSLSGGETFLVSLSLALALSDLAAQKVEISSLFIDEGFGSLDKLTLDQTMDTLEKLQYETSKTIGVISHVEAMQERITTQIRVEKGGQGHSSLLVV